jgi:hypothetical protein
MCLPNMKREPMNCLWTEYRFGLSGSLFLQESFSGDDIV